MATSEQETTEESTTTDSQSTQTTTTTLRTTPQHQCSCANHLHRVNDCAKFWWKFENNSRIISCSRGLPWNHLTKRCDEHSFFQCLSGIWDVHLKTKKNVPNLLFYNILILCVCVCVWPAIDSAPGHHTDMRPVSLEPVWPEGVSSEKIFLEKWPVAKLSNKNVMSLMLFYGKFYINIYIYIPVHFERPTSSSLIWTLVLNLKIIYLNFIFQPRLILNLTLQQELHFYVQPLMAC